MRLVLPQIENMSAYVPGEQPDPQSRVIKLNTNENPYPPSPNVAAALLDEINRGREPGDQLRLYSDPQANVFRAAAAETWNFPFEGILAGNGSDELLAIVFRACLSAGGEAVAPYPTYSLYEVLAGMQGAKLKTFDFGPDFRLPAELFGNRAPLTLIASPNAPIGTLYAPAELGRLADSLAGILLVDEAYIAFSAADDQPPRGALELALSRPNVVVVRTLSKSHSLAGMRLGLAFASPKLISEFDKVRDSYNLDRLALRAGAEAVKDQPWVARNVAAVRATRNVLVEGLKALGLEPLPSEANFVFARFPKERFKEPARAAAETYRRLKERGILVRYFPGRLTDDGLRVTVGTDEAIAVFLRALKECAGKGA
jgi:histidinol-phosphate aminotransferase